MVILEMSLRPFTFVGGNSYAGTEQSCCGRSPLCYVLIIYLKDFSDVEVFHDAEPLLSIFDALFVESAHPIC